MSIMPEDILPNDINELEIDGIKARKGTVAAVLANAKILSSTASSESAKVGAKETIKKLAPMLIALELHEHLTWKNPEIQQIIDEMLEANNKL
ncbi:hypothetical protein [Pigmentibacter ruber]|uniref:hypothetical protein n=1 Tax=Pigmentibacter ruber TaxID=2683196 RepID=UPI00131AE9C7|nr:hypothetical protein [Pigmentibacter ruber]